MKKTAVSMLIVDDEPSNRYSLSQIFSCKGHIVRVAEDGFSALGVIRGSIPDVLLCDLNMPRMSGFELLSVVRRRFPQVYVIAMSGAFAGGDVPQDVAADAFYSKGTGLVKLFSLVADGVEEREIPLRVKRRTAPVWIPSIGLSAMRADPVRAERSRQVLVGCPECLRPFQLALVSEGQALVANCLHCNIPFDYAVVA